MPKPGCKVFQKTQQAEKQLREALNDSEHEMALMDAAALGNVITSLVRWQHRHYAACAYCEAERVLEVTA